MYFSVDTIENISGTKVILYAIISTKEFNDKLLHYECICTKMAQEMKDKMLLIFCLQLVHFDNNENML